MEGGGPEAHGRKGPAGLGVGDPPLHLPLLPGLYHEGGEAVQMLGVAQPPGHPESSVMLNGRVHLHVYSVCWFFFLFSLIQTVILQTKWLNLSYFEMWMHKQLSCY